MSNELLFLILSLLGPLLIVFTLYFGRESLFVVIAVNLILVSALGSEIISLVGAVTNAGNVFYALAIFALAILHELYGKKTARRAVWVGFIGVVIFVVMTQVTIQFAGSAFSQVPQGSFEIVFEQIPRIAFASSIAYLIAAHFFVWLYDRLRRKLVGFRLMGIAYLASVFAMQVVDSAVFFSVAFGGLMPAGILLQIMAVGFLSKFAVAIVSTPFLYWSRRFFGKGQMNKDYE